MHLQSNGHGTPLCGTPRAAVKGEPPGCCSKGGRGDSSGLPPSPTTTPCGKRLRGPVSSSPAADVRAGYDAPW
ncbi:hypothetical protein STTU_5576 [Streptomyces sp. Tu6071]|nr:hypothetical protein STTU_5576 [Streptomyces sp. Tu6071]